MSSLGIEPTTFGAADAMLYHWATGKQEVSIILVNVNLSIFNKLLKSKDIYIHIIYWTYKLSWSNNECLYLWTNITRIIR